MFEMKQEAISKRNRAFARLFKATKSEGMKPAISWTKDQSKKVDQFAKSSYKADNE